MAGTRVYTAEGGGKGAEAAYNTVAGARAWRARGDGNVQALTVLVGEVYLDAHFDAVNGRPRHALAAADATTGALDAHWTSNETPVAHEV